MTQTEALIRIRQLLAGDTPPRTAHDLRVALVNAGCSHGTATHAITHAQATGDVKLRINNPENPV